MANALGVAAAGHGYTKRLAQPFEQRARRRREVPLPGPWREDQHGGPAALGDANLHLLDLGDALPVRGDHSSQPSQRIVDARVAHETLVELDQVVRTTREQAEASLLVDVQ